MLIHVITGFTAQIKFRFNWKVTLLAACLFPFLLMLGFWQLDRAAEKQRIIDLQQQQQTLPAIAIELLPSLSSVENTAGAPLNYRKVILRGSFDRKHYWLLDNKVRAGRVGYEIVAPLILTSNSGRSVLVNLGWLASNDRTTLPSVALPAGTVEINGLLTLPSSNAVFSNVDTSVWPKRVLHIDTLSAATALGLRVDSSVLLIDDYDPLALTTGWKLINQTPAKHHGYAVQWFAMAVALVISMVFSCTNLGQLISTRKQIKHNKNSKEVLSSDSTNR